ncbi:MAG: hypothetical protein IPO22_05360 [Anaerolineales bacterium]|nr:hypothetical protein [Anaerolineales bacterium]
MIHRNQRPVGQKTLLLIFTITLIASCASPASLPQEDAAPLSPLEPAFVSSDIFPTLTPFQPALCGFL